MSKPFVENAARVGILELGGMCCILAEGELFTIHS